MLILKRNREFKLDWNYWNWIEVGNPWATEKAGSVPCNSGFRFTFDSKSKPVCTVEFESFPLSEI